MRGYSLMIVALLVAVSTRADAALAQAVGASGSPAVASPGTEAVLFYMVGGVAALSALGCVLFKNVVRMAVCLFGTLGAAAGLYFLMAANFLGAIQLIVYAGGTLIVIIFGIMLTSSSPKTMFNPKPVEVVVGLLACVGLFVGMTLALTRTAWGRLAAAGGDYTLARIGESLLTTYLLPFEAASVLLLAVMIGAAYLCRRGQD
jgi:NADH:ubiquinone oxidoreductase subunit 6 (subunit J)